MWLTLSHIPRRKFTRQYPEQPPGCTATTAGANLSKTPRPGEMRRLSVGEFVCPPKAIQSFRQRPADADAHVEKEPAIS